MSDKTVRSELVVIGEFLDQAGVWAWDVEPQHADLFLGNAHKDQAVATVEERRARSRSDWFLELRHQGEILALTGSAVTSPIDEINRPVHSGDFAVRIPPSARSSPTSSRAGARASSRPASGATRPATTRWPASPPRWGCGRARCAC